MSMNIWMIHLQSNINILALRLLISQKNASSVQRRFFEFSSRDYRKSVAIAIVMENIDKSVKF